MNRPASLGLAAMLAGCLDQTPNSSLPPPLIVREAELQQALETMPSGTAVTWRLAADGQVGTIVPIRTFRTTNGYCREYRVTLRRSDGVDSTWRDIACRDAAGIWRGFEAGA